MLPASPAWSLARTGKPPIANHCSSPTSSPFPAMLALQVWLFRTSPGRLERSNRVWTLELFQHLKEYSRLKEKKLISGWEGKDSLGHSRMTWDPCISNQLCTYGCGRIMWTWAACTEHWEVTVAAGIYWVILCAKSFTWLFPLNFTISNTFHIYLFIVCLSRLKVCFIVKGTSPLLLLLPSSWKSVYHIVAAQATHTE